MTFRNRYSNLPPGLAKGDGNLPQGLEEQLQRNGELPWFAETHRAVSA
jgi:hypothetical protein